jgi:hypothetical protein
MTATVAGSAPLELGQEVTTTAQSGAASFSDVVRTHFKRETARAARDDGAAEDADKEFQGKLKEFEGKEGEIVAVYWSTRNASAVAMTTGRSRGKGNPLVDTETAVRLHRVTDWVTRDSDAVADALHACDLLAIRVGEILRGTSERIAMRWLYSVEEHLLGFIERTNATDPDREHEVACGVRKFGFRCKRSDSTDEPTLRTPQATARRKALRCDPREVAKWPRPQWCSLSSKPYSADSVGHGRKPCRVESREAILYFPPRLRTAFSRPTRQAT